MHVRGMLLLLLASASVGCASEPTALYFVVDSDLDTPSQIDELALDAMIVGGASDSRRASSESALRVRIDAPADATDAELVVIARATRGGTTVVQRRVRTRFVPGRVHVIAIHLAEVCAPDPTCVDGETCVAGRCVSDVVDASREPRWDGHEPEVAPVDGGELDGGVDAGDGGVDGGDGGPGATCPEPPAPITFSECSGVQCPSTRECIPRTDIPDALPMCRVVPYPQVELAAGRYHTCMRTGEARVVVACWGEDGQGQLGGPASATPGPNEENWRVVVVPYLVAPTAIGAGDAFSCAIDGGEIVCWGAGTESWGRELACEGVHARITLPDGAVPSRVDGGDGYACALDEDGGVWCWGRGSEGQLGRALASSSFPVRVALPMAADELSVGPAHACALETTTGRAWCWGDNAHAELGTGSNASVVGPQEVAASVRDDRVVLAIATGLDHTCAVVGANASDVDREVRCWGRNQLLQTSAPTGAERPGGVTVQGSVGATAVFAGYDHSCFERFDERFEELQSLYCWGANAELQTGQEAPTPRRVADRANHTDPFLGVVLGAEHTCYLQRNNRFQVCLGGNDRGQLGIPGPSQWYTSTMGVQY